MSKVGAPVNRSNLATIDPETIDKWEQAPKSAKDAGIIFDVPDHAWPDSGIAS